MLSLVSKNFTCHEPYMIAPLYVNLSLVCLNKSLKLNLNLASQGKGSTNQQNSTSTKPLYGRQLKTLKKESRATRLLAAIIFGNEQVRRINLLFFSVFISLWAPYNILVVYSTFDNNKVPPLAWNLRGLFSCSWT